MSGIVMTLKKKANRMDLGKPRSSLSGKKTLYIMLIPCILFVLIFAYLPLCGWIISLFNYKPGLPLFKCDFVGLKYFIMILTQPDLLPILRNTLVFSFLNILCSPLPMIFAIILSEMRSKVFKSFIQTTTTLPNFISWPLVFAVFFVMFSPNDGIINKVLLNLHLISAPMDPIGNGDITWFFQTGIHIWKTLGFSAVIYMASIAGIDQELYDAADVDGAGRFKRIIHITIPCLLPTYFTLLILNIGQLLNNGFEQYYLFYNGMVADKIEVLDYYVYKIGIRMENFSLSTAIGISKTLVSVTLLTIANQMSKRMRGVSIL